MALTKATFSMIDGAVLNVLDFGAVGDGVTDDTAAIQAAINASNNRTLFFPTGTYLVSSIISVANKKIRIVGEGIRNTVLHRNGNAIGLKVEQGTSAGLTSDFGISDIQLSNVSIQLYNYISFCVVDNVSIVKTVAATNNYSGLVSVEAVTGDATFVSNLQITNSRFFGMYAGIAVENATVQYTRIFIANNYLTNHSYSGISIGRISSSAIQTQCIVTDNVIENIGDYSGVTAPNSYVVGIRVDGDDILVSNNIVRNVVTAAYWESDGIYVKPKKAIVSNNILVNAGYRSAITTKQLDLNGSFTTESVLIDSNQIYFDAVNTGFAGNPGGVFDGITNLYGGINTVSDNTTISNNQINGAGWGIYAVNSIAAWLINNLNIVNNKIVKNRGINGIYLTGAGTDWVVANNTICDFNRLSAGPTYGINIEFTFPAYYATDPSIPITSDPVYADKKIINLSVSQNFVDVDYSQASGNYAIALTATDATAGGAMPTFPSSFQKCSVVNNMTYASNAGAGTAYAYLVTTEPARFVNCHFDTKYLTTKTGIALPTGYGISGYRTNTASPSGVITPYWIGDWAFDTVAAKWYKSVGLTNTDWVALN
jgi:hypothetical protein